MELTSLQNKKVKYWVSLRKKKNRDKDKVFLIEGEHLIIEALKQNLVVETISTKDSSADYLVTKEIMKKISSQASFCDTMAVCRYIEENDVKGNVLILDNIQDPGNMGTLIRSAFAFDFSTIIVSNNSVDTYNDKVIRATEGQIFNVNILRKNLEEVVPLLKKLGYKIIGTDVLEGISIRDIIAKKKALVVGNEGQGISDVMRNFCDEMVNISINKECESLNVAIAASILMYEVYNGK